MTSTVAGTHREVEFKFRVPEDFPLAALLQGEFHGVAEPDRHMKATYFDTTDATLLRWGITLRHRTGGSDDGWHLKIPVDRSQAVSGASVRQELHSNEPAGTPPAEFLSVVGALLREAELVPLATVETQRTPYLIRVDGEPALEIVSDRVRVYRGPDVVDSFREIEVELLSADALPAAKTFVRSLRTAGAEESSVSKAAAAFGGAAARQPDIPALPRPRKSALPYDIIRWAITKQARRLLMAEVESHLVQTPQRLVTELQNMHQLLTILHNFLDAAETQEVIGEIDWLLTEMSSPTQVTRDQEIALAAISLIDDPLDRHEATIAVEDFFRSRAASIQSSAVAAQRSDRYMYFFSDIMDFATVPPVTERAYVPGKLWPHIDSTDRSAAAEIFHKVYPKKARRILQHSVRAQSDSDARDIRQLFRRIALHSSSGSAASFALGIAVGESGRSGNTDRRHP